MQIQYLCHRQRLVEHKSLLYALSGRMSNLGGVACFILPYPPLPRHLLPQDPFKWWHSNAKCCWHDNMKPDKPCETKPGCYCHWIRADHNIQVDLAIPALERTPYLRRARIPFLSRRGKNHAEMRGLERIALA